MPPTGYSSPCILTHVPSPIVIMMQANWMQGKLDAGRLDARRLDSRTLDARKQGCEQCACKETGRNVYSALMSTAQYKIAKRCSPVETQLVRMAFSRSAGTVQQPQAHWRTHRTQADGTHVSVTCDCYMQKQSAALQQRRRWYS